MKVYVFGVYTYKTYGGNLVEIKVIAKSRGEARKIVESMVYYSTYINADEGILLNDEYDYTC